jgi:hypothetical protein
LERTVTNPHLEPVFDVRAEVGPPIEIGAVGRGRRRIVPILGGHCHGRDAFQDLLTGRVLPGGADWQLIHDDGLTEADARYTIETARGELVYVQNRGIRHAAPGVIEKLLAGQAVDPSLVYFCSAPIFETSAADLQFLVRSIFVGVGERYPAEVVIRFWKVG